MNRQQQEKLGPIFDAQIQLNGQLDVLRHYRKVGFNSQTVIDISLELVLKAWCELGLVIFEAMPGDPFYLRQEIRAQLGLTTYDSPEHEGAST